MPVAWARGLYGYVDMRSTETYGSSFSPTISANENLPAVTACRYLQETRYTSIGVSYHVSIGLANVVEQGDDSFPFFTAGWRSFLQVSEKNIELCYVSPIKPRGRQNAPCEFC